jgi:uncharacterized protein
MDSKINLNFNKEIYLLRLAVTTECVLRCKYCFVRKDKGVISYSNAIQSIKLLLNSPGSQKVLIIYGGEPLLYFDLLKKIIIFAQKKAKILKKSLIVSLGTNGILLNQNQLNFFKKTNTKLALSMDGQRKFHNKARIFKNQKGSFDFIFNQLPIIFKNIKKQNLCVLFGVLPSSAYKMYDNLIYLTNLGFDSINIEPIQSPQFKWNQKQKKNFLLNLINCIKYIYKNILYGKFIFLNSVNRELKNKRLSIRKNICPFFENLEVYPQGEMAFSPFLINSKNRERYIIGNIKDGLPKKYIFCNFNSNNEKCKNCWHDYLGDENQDYGNNDKVLKWRDDYSIYLSRKILTPFGQQSIFKKYIKEAKKRIFE